MLHTCILHVSINSGLKHFRRVAFELNRPIRSLIKIVLLEMLRSRDFSPVAKVSLKIVLRGEGELINQKEKPNDLFGTHGRPTPVQI